MNPQIEGLIKKAYSSYNSRDIDSALSTFHPEVEWPKAFEGGYVSGHEAVRKYWTRQWTEINPNVKPIGFIERPNGTFEVSVLQKVEDLKGELICNGVVTHIITLKDNLFRRMDIEIE